MANPLDSMKPSFTPELLVKEKVQMTREMLSDHPSRAAEYSLNRCRALRGALSMTLAGMTLPKLPESPEQCPYLNGGKELESRSVEASSSWLGRLWSTSTDSQKLSEADQSEVLAELEKMDGKIQSDYRRLCQIHSQLCAVLDIAQQTETSLDNDIPFYDKAVENQQKDQEELGVMANELLDEFEKLKNTFLTDIQQRDQGRYQEYDQNPSRANFSQALIGHVRSLENELRQKTRMLEAKNQEVQQLDKKIQELTRQVELSEKQMFQALTEQDRLGRVDHLAVQLETDLRETRDRVVLFQDVARKAQEEKAKESRRVEDLDFRLNQVTRQLREKRELEGQFSELGKINRGLQRKLQSAEANFASAVEHLEKFAELQKRNELMQSQLNAQARDFKKIISERDEAKSKVAAVEKHLKSHSSSAFVMQEEKAKAERGLVRLQSQIRQLETQLNDERKRYELLEAEKLSSDSEVRKLRGEFATKVKDERFVASLANIQLQKELNERKAEYEKERAHYVKLASELDSLKAEMDRERRKATEYFTTSQRLEREAREAKKNLSQLQTQKTKLEKQLSEVSSQLEVSNGKVSKLEDLSRRQEAELKTLRLKASELKASKEGLSAVNRELHQTKSELQRKVQAEKTLQEELRQKEDEVRGWIMKSQKWNTARASLEGKVQSVSQQLDKLSQERDRVAAELRQKSTQVDNLSKSLQEVTTRLKHVQNSAKSGQSTNQQTIEALKVDLAESKRLLKLAQEELVSSEAKFKKSYGESEERVSELTKQLVSTKAKLTSAEDAEKRAMNEAAKAKSGCTVIEKEAATLREETTSLRKQFNALSTEHKQQMAAKLELEKEMVTLRSEVESLREKAKTTDHLEEQVRLSRRSLEEKQMQMSTLERDLKAQLEGLKQELETSRDKLHEEEGKTLGLQLDYNSANSQVVKLKAEFAEAMAELEKLREQTKNPGQAGTLGSGFNFQESGVEYDDGNPYVSLGASLHQPPSLVHQPLGTVYESSLSSLQVHGDRGVSRFEFQDMKRQKEELDQQIADLKEELRISRHSFDQEKRRANKASWEVGDVKEELSEVKAQNSKLLKAESDQILKEKKLREEVRKLNGQIAQLKLDHESELKDEREFGEKASARNADLETSQKHMRSELEDLKYRLEKDMPQVMLENRTLTEQNKVLQGGLLEIVQLFRDHLPEDDEKVLDEKIQAMAAYLLPKQ